MEVTIGLLEAVGLVHIIDLLEAHHLVEAIIDLLAEVLHLEQLDHQALEVRAEVLEEVHHLEEEETKISITF